MKNFIQKSIKTAFLFSIFFSLFSAYAQVPQAMSYQMVVRNASNQLVANAPVGVKISILQGSATGTAVYEETHTTTTNLNGLATLEIGNGTIFSGYFAFIDWSAGPYFVKTETDPTGGTLYSISGTSQLLSVPYALIADKSKDNLWNKNQGIGGIQYIFPSNPNPNNYRVGIGTGSPSEMLDVAGKTSTTDLTVYNNAGIGINTPEPSAYGYSGTNKILEISNNFFEPNSQSQLILSSKINGIGNIGGVTFVDKDPLLGGNKRMAAITSQYNDAVLDYDGDGVSESGGSLDFWTNKDAILSQRMKIKINGNVGIGTTNPTEKLEVAGKTKTTNLQVDNFSKLGSDSPAIKVKKLTGVTASSDGQGVAVAHNLNSSKILSINVLVEYAPGQYVPSLYPFSVPLSTSDNSLQFSFYSDESNIWVWLKAGSSSDILSKPFKIMITYEE